MISRRKKQSSDAATDADLGQLTFATYGDTAAYSCNLKLPFSSKKIDIFFNTPSKQQLPSVLQKEFLSGIIANYDNLIEKTIQEITIELVRSNFKEIKINKNDLQSISLIIPQVDTNNFNWDMTFEMTSIKDIFIIVYFDHYTPISVEIEKDERKPLTRFLLNFLNGS